MVSGKEDFGFHGFQGEQSMMGVPVIYKIDSQLNANEGGGGGIIRISKEP